MSERMTADDFHPGRLVMVGVQGKTLDQAQAVFLRRHHIRAVVLFRDNLGTEDDVRALTAGLREAMGPGALIGIDQEGGAVVRATFLPQPPAAMALGAAGDASLARDVGAAVARGIRSIGFNWNFAPVLDVNNNPENPVIAERSFSANPEDVARLGAAWMCGALSERVACCVKHFPGHGDTHVDSHLDLPVVDKSRESLDTMELAPFFALRDEAPAMMTAHIVYPKIDPRHPATLSRVILGGVLRDEWRYDGVVITDSLAMKAIHDRYGHDRAAVLALQAGADMVMALGSADEQAAAIDAIQRALDRGELDRGSFLRARARLDALPTTDGRPCSRRTLVRATVNMHARGARICIWCCGTLSRRSTWRRRRSSPGATRTAHSTRCRRGSKAAALHPGGRRCRSRLPSFPRTHSTPRQSRRCRHDRTIAIALRRAHRADSRAARPIVPHRRPLLSEASPARR